MDHKWIEAISPRLRTLWRGAWKAGTIEPERYLHDHELVLVTAGSCEVSLDGARIPLVAGDFLVIPPDTGHTTTCRQQVSRTCIHFDWLPRPEQESGLAWSYAPQRPLEIEIARTPDFVPTQLFQGSFTKDGPLPGLIDSLFFRWQSGKMRDVLTARAHFLELLANLFFPREESPPAAAQARFQLARSAKALLDSHLLTNDSIQDLLASLGFSHAHVSRLFRMAFGLTPVEYRNAARLELAKSLLRDSHLTVAEVAYRSGFEDPSYFTRIFQRRTNLRPREFRAGLRKLTDL